MTRSRPPVVIELDDAAPVTPADAPAVGEDDPVQGTAMQGAMRLAGAPRRGSALGRWFWRLLGAVLAFGVSLWAWDWFWSLLDRSPAMATAAGALIVALVLVLCAIILREMAALGRLRRLGDIRAAAEAARADGGIEAAREVTARLVRLYAGRDDTAWGLARLAEREADVLDGDALLKLAETDLLAPLDAAARTEIEAASRQVATITAIVPLALADVAVALTANLRMIRRIAEIYGGRAGTMGSWRLVRRVMGHLVATGAIAVGDDLIGSVAGGGILSKVSRRFGEGVINGALTARVGIAAVEVCRPLPFAALARPKVGNVVGRALAGLFDRSGNT